MRAAFLILALGLSACNSSSPTAPTPPPAPLVSLLPLPGDIRFISVIGNQWITLPSSPVQMTARLVTNTAPLEYVDGSTGVTWTVHPAGVATVDRQGRVTPLAPGAARVIATYGHLTSAYSIRVLPDYAGRWSGDYFITGCTGLPDPRTCGRNMFDTNGNRLLFPLALTLIQDRDQITGSLEQTNSARQTGIYPVTGFVRLNGTLVLEGERPNPGFQPTRIFNWSSTLSGTPARLSGGYSTAGESMLSVGNWRYSYRIEHEFVGLSRAP